MIVKYTHRVKVSFSFKIFLDVLWTSVKFNTTLFKETLDQSLGRSGKNMQVENAAVDNRPGSPSLSTD